MKNRSLSIVMRRVFHVLVAVVIMFVGIKIPYIPSIQFNVQAVDVFNTYNLTETELKKIASLCQQEQGTAKGAAAEASLMANRFEMYGSKFSSVYDYARNSGWFAKAGTYMDKMNATDAVIEAVRNVLINGKRTIPGYIDEHDCFSDLKSCTNNGVSITIKDRSQYKQFVTIINNVYGSKYTFYCFPTSSSDPFGYISETKRSQIGEAYYDYDTGELINGPTPPIVTPTISTDKSSYVTGETVYLSWAASPSNSNLSHYWLNVIAPDGTYVYGDGMSKNTSYSFVASQSGSYSITTYATPLGSANGEGSLSDSVSISVSQPVWHADLSPVDVGSGFYAYIINVDSWNHLTNDNGNVATYPETGAANQIWKFDRRADGSYKITNCADGNVLDVANFGNTNGTNVAICDINDDSAQRWFIYGSSGDYRFRAACTDCVIDAVKSLPSGGTNVEMWTKNDNSGQVFQIWKLMPELSVKPGNQAELTVFSWENFPGDDRFYDLKIWRGTLWEGDPYYIEWGLNGTSYEIGLPVGHYEAYVDTRVGSQILMNNVVKFDITEDYFGQSELKVVTGDKYTKTHFEWTPVENAEFYDLKIWNGLLWNDDPYQIVWGINGTSTDLALPDGYYEAYVDARNSNNMQMSNVIKFTVKEECVLLDGDANLDGEVTVADAVMLQKWLLGASDKLTCWQNIDLCEDNKIDVFDLCMLKKMLIERN